MTAISQHYYHACTQNDGQLVAFDQLFSKKAVAGAIINQIYNIQLFNLLAPSVTG